MGRLNMASFLRGLALGMSARAGRTWAGSEAEAYCAGYAGMTYPTRTRSELASWFQGIGDHAGQ